MGMSCPKQPEMNAGCARVAKQGRVTKAEEKAASYLAEHRIPELFNFLMAHLIAERPPEPVGFLLDLIDRCVLFRAGLVEPPLLFSPKHIESMYKSLDPEGIGSITLEQYSAGMKSLGISCVDPKPMECECDPDEVDKETFLSEAKKCLEKMLKQMISIPRVCE